MRDDPSGAALLDAARKALVDEVVPGLTGRPRYVALMVANALGIAMREIEAADATAGAAARVLADTAARVLADTAGDDAAALAQAIRAGTHDADPDLHAALTGAAEIAAGIWKPAGSR